jgi:hypothetical protein
MRVETTPGKKEDFSLFLGGPLYQLLLRVGLLRPPLDRLKWRLLTIVGLAWAPLAVLTLLDGRCLGGVKVPFLRDFEVHVRLLAALPLLIAAEVVIHDRITVILRRVRSPAAYGPGPPRSEPSTRGATLFPRELQSV